MIFSLEVKIQICIVFVWILGSFSLGERKDHSLLFSTSFTFFVPRFDFHFSFQTIFLDFSRQSIPIPDQIQPLFLFQVSVIHSDFYFRSVFASGVFALLLSCSLLSAFASMFYSSFLAVFSLDF